MRRASVAARISVKAKNSSCSGRILAIVNVKPLRTEVSYENRDLSIRWRRDEW
jgi:hypothetical protein